LAELGIIAPQGREGVKELLAIVADDATTHLPNDARASPLVLAARLQALPSTPKPAYSEVSNRSPRSRTESPPKKLSRLEAISGRSQGVLGSVEPSLHGLEPSLRRRNSDIENSRLETGSENWAFGDG
jgi:hypothetical protein